MNKELVYVVIGEGEVAFASRDEEIAEGHCDEHNYKAVENALVELGYEHDDPDEGHRDQATFYAGQQGDIWWVGSALIDFDSDSDTEVRVDAECGEAFVTISEIIENVHEDDDEDDEYDEEF